MCGFEAFSPFTVRSVIAAAAAIPFDQVLGGREERVATLKQDVVRAGIEAVTGIDMPVHPKRRFQDGALASPRARVTKTWCRTVFTKLWESRLREANDNLDARRSGNEMEIRPGSFLQGT
jgi:asparagine synthase (glutamine-hydrolysing)